MCGSDPHAGTIGRPERCAQLPRAADQCAMIWPRALIVKIRFSLEGHHRFSENWITPCKHREPSTFEIWSGSVVRRQRSQQPARLWNFLKSDRDAVLVVREPFGDRARAAVLVTAAIVASFGLGWAGGLNWPQFASELGLWPLRRKKRPRRKFPKHDQAAGLKALERRHPRRIRPPLSAAFPSHPSCCRAVHARSLPGQCGPFRRCDRDAAAPGGSAGNQAGDDSRLDGCRCSGRHRGSGRS